MLPLSLSTWVPSLTPWQRGLRGCFRRPASQYDQALVCVQSTQAAGDEPQASGDAVRQRGHDSTNQCRVTDHQEGRAKGTLITPTASCTCTLDSCKTMNHCAAHTYCSSAQGQQLHTMLSTAYLRPRARPPLRLDADPPLLPCAAATAAAAPGGGVCSAGGAAEGAAMHARRQGRNQASSAVSHAPSASSTSKRSTTWHCRFHTGTLRARVGASATQESAAGRAGLYSCMQDPHGTHRSAATSMHVVGSAAPPPAAAPDDASTPPPLPPAPDR